jgi:hypothetical protein
MKDIKKKALAIWDIITTNKFYLVTFKENGDVNWRTEFNIIREDYKETI